jgi:hypothetical protein
MIKRILFFILCFFITLTGFTQSVSNPTASSYPQSTSNQSISGFSVSGFNSTSTLLVTIGLVNPPSGTTLRLGSTSGITASTGYSLTSNFTRISFTGTQSNINTVLSSLRLNTGSVPGNVYIAVTATINPSGYFYLPTNGHFYRPITGSITYTNSKNSASSQTFKGQSGYLVTITSQDEQNFINANVPVSNIWFALSDAGLEGRWRIDAGPENGTLVWTASTNVSNSTTGSYSSAGTTAPGQFTAWASGEPNNSDGSIGEDHAVTKWGGANTWNDLRDGNSSSIGGYVVEFGTWTDPANQTFTDFYTGFVTHQIACSPATSPNSPIGTNGSRLNAGTVTLSATAPSGSTIDWYASSTGGNVLSGGLGTFTFTTPSISNTTTYYAQSRNTTTGCVSSSRTAVIATINYPIPFTYSGFIYNIDDTGISGVEIKAFYKLKSSSTYTLHSTTSTNINGSFNINTNLDTTNYDFRIIIENLIITTPNQTDALLFNQKVLEQNFNSIDYYRMNINENNNLSITDIYLIYRRMSVNSWTNGVPAYRIFNQSEWNIIKSTNGNLINTYPGTQTITLNNPLTGGSSSFYVIKTGHHN